MAARPLGGGVDAQCEQIRGADETCDERTRRMFVELARRRDLLDQAAVHDGDAVAHGERLFLVVRDVHERRLRARLDLLELELHLLAQLEVERAERLVEQERGRLVDERARERDALLLAAGELARLALLHALEAHRAQRRGDARAHLVAAHALDAQPERHVLEHAHVREERVRLEHHVDVPLGRRHVRDVAAAQEDAAAASAPRSPRSCAASSSCRSPDGPSIEKNSP